MSWLSNITRQLANNPAFANRQNQPESIPNYGIVGWEAGEGPLGAGEMSPIWGNTETGERRDSGPPPMPNITPEMERVASERWKQENPFNPYAPVALGGQQTPPGGNTQGSPWNPRQYEGGGFANVNPPAGQGELPLWQIPPAPYAPGPISAQGALTQGGPTVPTGDWYSSIAPEVMQGLEAPYDRARSQMFEQLGSMGQMGSPGALSGAAGAALGKFEAGKADQLGLQAWNMMQPGLESYRQDIGRENLYDVGGLNQQIGQDYRMAQNVWNQQSQMSQFPYTSLPGMMGGTYPNPVIDQNAGGGGTPLSQLMQMWAYMNMYNGG